MSTRAQLLAEIATNFPDNTSGLITPAILRTVENDIVNAVATLADTNSFAAAQTFVGGVVVNNVYFPQVVADGLTDNTTVIQNAINAANAAGGGIVYFSQAGKIISTQLTLYTNIVLKGMGPEKTILELKGGANQTLIKSYLFDSLTNTGSTEGIHNWAILDMTIDGNAGNNSSGVDCIQVYGYEYVMNNVIVRAAKVDGLYTEWSTSTTKPSDMPNEMEAFITNCKFHHCGNCGVNFYGPHDSFIANVFAWQNAYAGFALPNDLDPNSSGGGSQWVNCHSYGAQQYAFIINEPSIWTNIAAEGGSVGQIFMGGNKVKLNQAILYNPTGSAYGIQIGNQAGDQFSVDHFPQQCQIDVHCYGTTWVFGFEGGQNRLAALIYGTSGAVVSGSPRSAADISAIDINVYGGATGSFHQFPSTFTPWGIYNPAVLDQTTNYELLGLRWNGSATEIGNLFGGTGNAFRALRIGVASNAASSLGRYLTIQNALPFISYSLNTGSAGATAQFGGTLSASSGDQSPFDVNTIWAQTGTATGADLPIDCTDTSSSSGGRVFARWKVGGVLKFQVDHNGAITNYQGVSTAGDGVPAIRGFGRLNAQTAAVATVATFTPSANGIFSVSANVLVTTATTHNFTMTVSYTDEAGVSRVATINFQNLAGTISPNIINTGGAVPYLSLPITFYAESGQPITVSTVGTFTAVAYNCVAEIEQK